MCLGEEPLPRNHFRFRKVEKKVSWQNAEPSGFEISPKSFVKIHRGFIKNPTKVVEVSTKPLWFFTKLLGLIWNPDGSTFCHETFFSTLRNLKWFRGNGSSPGHIVRTIKIFQILIFIFIDILSHVEAFHIYGTILVVSVKNRFF